MDEHDGDARLVGDARDQVWVAPVELLPVDPSLRRHQVDEGQAARSGEVTSYEDLVGSHGGLGGRQVEPFILHPADLPIGDEPLVGAVAVNGVLRRWLETLGGTEEPSADPAGSAASRDTARDRSGPRSG